MFSANICPLSLTSAKEVVFLIKAAFGSDDFGFFRISKIPISARLSFSTLRTSSLWISWSIYHLTNEKQTYLGVCPVSLCSFWLSGCFFRALQLKKKVNCDSFLIHLGHRVIHASLILIANCDRFWRVKDPTKVTSSFISNNSTRR